MLATMYRIKKDVWLCFMLGVSAKWQMKRGILQAPRAVVAVLSHDLRRRGCQSIDNMVNLTALSTGKMKPPKRPLWAIVGDGFGKRRLKPGDSALAGKDSCCGLTAEFQIACFSQLKYEFQTDNDATMTEGLLVIWESYHISLWSITLDHIIAPLGQSGTLFFRKDIKA